MERFRKLTLIIALVTLVGLGMSSCGNADDPPAASGTEAGSTDGNETPSDSPDDSEGTAPEDDSSSGNESDTDDNSSAAECFVHLFDDEDFDEDDDHFRLTKPGRYGDLSNLPGANKDWHDEADSIRVGSGATVIIWDKPQFKGNKTQLAAGTEIADLDDEPESLELRCP